MRNSYMELLKPKLKDFVDSFYWRYIWCMLMSIFLFFLVVNAVTSVEGYSNEDKDKNNIKKNYIL